MTRNVHLKHHARLFDGDGKSVPRDNWENMQTPDRIGTSDLPAVMQLNRDLQHNPYCHDMISLNPEAAGQNPYKPCGDLT